MEGGQTCTTNEDDDEWLEETGVWQVRQPLHRNRVGRWQHYEPFLRPVLGDALDQI